MAETPNARAARVERDLADLTNIVKLLANVQVQTENLINKLAKEAAQREKRLDQRIAKMDRRMDQRIEKLAAAMGEREKRIDERIEKLVIAIGEFIRRQNGKH